MHLLALLLFAIGFWPLSRALIANRRWTICHALAWALLTWLAWTSLAAVVCCCGSHVAASLCRYLALCLTGCCGVAVLGARRPGVSTWNLIVLGLLAVMLLPAAEKVVLGNDTLDWMRWLFLAGTILITVTNYLPTRLAAAAILTMVGCAWEGNQLLSTTENSAALSPGWICLALVPWCAYAGWNRRKTAKSAADDSWQQFRDRYGLVWGQLVRDQFTRAARNSNLQVTLTWGGIGQRSENSVALIEIDSEELKLLESLLKRFAPSVRTKR